MATSWSSPTSVVVATTSVWRSTAGTAPLATSPERARSTARSTSYSLLTVGFLALFAIECIVGYVLPTVALSDPGYVQDVLDAAVGGSPSGDIGHLQELFLAAGIGYPLGGLLFGIALFRAGVLSRWASLLLAYGTTSALALAVLP